MSFGERLGAALDRKRELKGWSYAQLALEIHGDDGQGGDSRKSDVEKFCKGQTKKPRAATLLKLRNAGLFTQEEIDACRTPQELELAQFADRLFAVIADAASGMGVDEGLAAEITEHYAEGNAGNFDAALTGLHRALEVAAKRPPATNQPEEVEAIIAEVRARNQESLEEGTAAIEAALQAQKDKQAEAEQATLRLLAAAINQAILTRSVPDAVRHTLDQLDREVPEPEARFEALRKRQDEWYERGRDQGLNFDLEVSIGLAEARRARAAGPDQMGAALNDLGTALRTLGERESGTARLEQAVAAYEAALLELMRERVPLDWAATQNNLGNALQTIGERESGTARLEQAVAAYEAALLEYTQERVPLDWAMTQNNLGAALLTLGEREKGTAGLEQAVAAFEAALLERTRERVPLDWAATQNNLGNALQNLGKRESGTARLEQAAAAYEAALLERTRERVPLDWAMTQNNLGTALRALGARESGTARLEQAVAAYEAALLEWTREQVPLDWAGTRGNQAVALFELGLRAKDLARLDAAIAILVEVETFLRQGGHIAGADGFKGNIALAQKRRTAMVEGGGA